MLLTDIGDGLLTFTPINQRCYLDMTSTSTVFFSAVNLDPRVYVWTDVFLFDDQFVGVKPTTEISPVIDLYVKL